MTTAETYIDDIAEESYVPFFPTFCTSGQTHIMHSGAEAAVDDDDNTAEDDNSLKDFINDESELSDLTEEENMQYVSLSIIITMLKLFSFPVSLPMRPTALSSTLRRLYNLFNAELFLQSLRGGIEHSPC